MITFADAILNSCLFIENDSKFIVIENTFSCRARKLVLPFITRRTRISRRIELNFWPDF